MVLNAILALSQPDTSHLPRGESDMIISRDNLESALIYYKQKVNY